MSEKREYRSVVRDQQARHTRRRVVDAAAASVALAIVFFSGKLRTPKDDWAANHIFVAGGLAIVVISLQAYATHRRLKARS